MNNRLSEILSSINGYYHYNDVLPRQYILLIKEAVGIIRELDAKPTSLLDNAKNEALTELSNELTNRMNANFFNANPDRRKNDFKISKMLVAVAIGNVLANLSPDESGVTSVE